MFALTTLLVAHAACLSPPDAGSADGDAGAGADAASGLAGDVLHLRFEDPDAIIDDANPARPVIAVGGIVLVPDGVSGMALHVDASHYLELPDDPAYLSPDGMTLEIWLRPDDEGSPCRAFFTSLGDGPYDLELASYFDAAIPSDVAVVFFGDGRTPVEAPVTLPAGVWTQLTLTWDYEEVRVYHDGEVIVGASSHGRPPDTVGPWRLGQRLDGSCELTGAIDEVRLSSGALTAAEIRAAYLADLGDSLRTSPAPRPAR